MKQMVSGCILTGLAMRVWSVIHRAGGSKKLHSKAQHKPTYCLCHGSRNLDYPGMTCIRHGMMRVYVQWGPTAADIEHIQVQVSPSEYNTVLRYDGHALNGEILGQFQELPMTGGNIVTRVAVRLN